MIGQDDKRMERRERIMRELRDVLSLKRDLRIAAEDAELRRERRERIERGNLRAVK